MRGGVRRFELYLAGDPKPSASAGPYLDPEAALEANESYRYDHFHLTYFKGMVPFLRHRDTPG